ncbi:hypothetical protein J2T13_002829 [Paenibacillus sp. DS2015]|uniref:hypothetical protein n=1 Tax=Paenibacillus sp. DS2015 TaxID=3373917 RepID=UPI003D1FF74C
MKKIVAVTAALGIMASMATGAFAAETTTTTGNTSPAITTTTTADGVTSTVYGDNDQIVSTPLITDDAITLIKEPILLLKKTYFYSTPNGKKVGALSSQLVSTTGNKVTDKFTGTWVEVYTWVGTSWILVD